MRPLRLVFDSEPNTCNGYALKAMATIVCVCLWILSVPGKTAQAQLTAKQLLAPTVEDYGPQYRNVEIAVAAFSGGNFDSASKSLQAAKTERPELPPADVMMALLYLSVGHVADAEAAIDRAAVSEPNDPEAFILLADLALRGEKLTIAELAYARGQQLAQAYTTNPYRLRNLTIRLHAGLASLSEARGQLELALAEINKWIELDPQNPMPLGSQGRVLFKLKKYEEARAAFTKLGEVEKDAPPVELSMGRLYSDAGMEKEALENMKLATETHSDDIRVRLTVAEWALTVGHVDLAKENVKAALSLDENSLGGQVFAARIARQEGRMEEAETILNKVVLQSPNSFAATNELARVLAGSDDEKKRRTALEYGRRNFQFAQSQNPGNSDAIVTYAWTLLQNDRAAEAEAALNALSSGSAISSENAFFAAKIYSQRGKPDLAVGALRAAMVRDIPFPGREQAQELLKRLTAQ